MIRVVIELWPHGDESRKRLLASADIGNDGTGSPEVGNYVYRLRNKAGAIWKKGHITGFPRQRATAWRLLRLILNDAFKDGAPNESIG